MNPLSTAIVDALQASLKVHWTAIETYTGQAAHFARRNYGHLANAATDDAEEERKHALKLLCRLEALDVAPAYDHAPPAWPRGDFAGTLAANLALEKAAALVERSGIVAARQAADEITAALFAANLAGSEASIVEIEAAQRSLGEIGLDNYLAAQL